MDDTSDTVDAAVDGVEEIGGTQMIKGAGAQEGQTAADISSDTAKQRYSGTNLQKEGVDESDFVKTDGSYIYTVSHNEILPYTNDFTFELLVSDEIQKLRGIHGFDNSLSFDEDGNTTTCIVLYAKKNDEIVALAGASIVDDDLREIGIDVKKEYRRKNLASLLVHNLTVAIMEQDKIPFYSASVTNIASQAVAIRSGYMPLWTDTYGTRGIC